MSRAFLKEDAPQPEPEHAGAFRVYWVGDRPQRDRELVNSGDDLVSMLLWAEARPRGHYQVRDGEDDVLAEIGG